MQYVVFNNMMPTITWIGFSPSKTLTEGVTSIQSDQKCCCNFLKHQACQLNEVMQCEQLPDKLHVQQSNRIRSAVSNGLLLLFLNILLKEL